MNSRARIIVVLVVMAAVAILTLSGSLPAPWQSDSDLDIVVIAQDLQSSDATFANCRYGASPLDGESTSVVSDLGAGWYLNFQAYPPTSAEPANGAEFVHMVDIHQKKCGDECYLPTYEFDPPLDAAYAKYIKEHPGGKYIAGNETDRIGQGETYPEVYAAAYHEIYNFIKGNDPSAQLAATALVQFTPNRKQYLDKIWSSYFDQFGSHMPVDIWTMHIYVLPELQADGVTPNGIANIALGTDKSLGKREAGGSAAICSDPDVYCFAEHDNLEIFKEHVVAMRQWMKDHGQQNKPLLLTEFSILFPYEDDGATCFLQDEYGNCFTPDRVTNFMNATFSYLNEKTDPAIGYPLDGNRLVQQWMWFSVYYPYEGSASNLAEADLKTLTKPGQNFKNHVAGKTLYQNLIVDNVADVSVATNGAATTTANISVIFRNNGNSSIKTPFAVSFFKNSNYTDKIGSVVIDPTVYGCSSQAYTAGISWPGLTKGTHNYYVYIDSGRTVNEVPSHDGDNFGQGTVTVYRNQINLPVVGSAQ